MQKLICKICGNELSSVFPNGSKIDDEKTKLSFYCKTCKKHGPDVVVNTEGMS